MAIVGGKCLYFPPGGIGITKTMRMKKIIRVTGLLLVAALLIFFFVRYYYVFGEGVKAGELNYLVKKGYIFKTYEGKLIQNGLRAGLPGTVQSYEFIFSVVNEGVAAKLMLSSGKNVQVHYREYMGKLPWRGYSEFIVDSIISVSDPVRIP